jgi:hypothetical protein
MLTATMARTRSQNSFPIATKLVMTIMTKRAK